MMAKLKKKHNDREYILNKKSPFEIREAYNMLRTNLNFTLKDEACRKLLITSTIKGEGKSTAAVNIGKTMAQGGEKVLLIECDLRLPTLSSKMGIPSGAGLSDVLRSKAGINDVIYEVESGLYVLPAGTPPSNPSELLASKRMKKLLTMLEKHFTYIILDAPPVTVVTDAVLLSSMSSGTIIVVRNDMTTVRGIEAALKALNTAKGRILGFLYVGADFSERTYSYYGGKYGNSYSRYASSYEAAHIVSEDEEEFEEGE